MIDLHIHTTYSDGTDTIQELLKKAEEKKLEIISITDHDSIDAYLEIEQNPNLKTFFSGKIVTGCEFKTFYKGISIEILGYNFNYKKIKMPNLNQKEIQEYYLKTFENILNRYGFKYNKEELFVDFNNPEKHYAGYIVAKELLKHPENALLIEQVGGFDENTFFRKQQCNKDSIFFIDESKFFPEVSQVIEIIHEAGGLAFLAHPYLYYTDNDKLIEDILSSTKIDGIECIYPLFSMEQRKKILEFARIYHKYTSGGTDYHAKNKPNIELGTGINNNVNISKDFILEWYHF